MYVYRFVVGHHYYLDRKGYKLHYLETEQMNHQTFSLSPSPEHMDIHHQSECKRYVQGKERLPQRGLRWTPLPLLLLPPCARHTPAVVHGESVSGYSTNGYVIIFIYYVQFSRKHAKIGAICIQRLRAITNNVARTIAFWRVLLRHESLVIHCRGLLSFTKYTYIWSQQPNIYVCKKHIHVIIYIYTCMVVVHHSTKEPTYK